MAHFAIRSAALFFSRHRADGVRRYRPTAAVSCLVVSFPLFCLKRVYIRATRTTAGFKYATRTTSRRRFRRQRRARMPATATMLLLIRELDASTC